LMDVAGGHASLCPPYVTRNDDIDGGDGIVAHC
jgi:hypothetical protein